MTGSYTDLIRELNKSNKMLVVTMNVFTHAQGAVCVTDGLNIDSSCLVEMGELILKYIGYKCAISYCKAVL